MIADLQNVQVWVATTPVDMRKSFDGLAIYYKRLERGEFQFPRTGKPVIEISVEQLLRLLSGLNVKATRVA